MHSMFPLFWYVPLILYDFRVLELQNKDPHCNHSITNQIIWANFKRKGEVAHERLTKPCLKIEWLLAKPRSFLNLPAFLMLMEDKFSKK